MSTNKSEHLKLHLWEPEDDFLRTEFNENFEAIDGAVQGEKTAREAAVQQLEQRISDSGGSASGALAQAKQELSAAIQSEANNRSQGDTALQTQLNAVKKTAENAYCPEKKPYAVGTYTGDGGYGSSSPTRIMADFPPKALLISGNGICYIAAPEREIGKYTTLTWESDGVSIVDSFAAKDQFNESGKTYSYLLLA